MDNLFEMLEHMSNIGVLVLARDDFEVLYCNQTFRNAFVGIEPGQKYEHIFPAEYEQDFWAHMSVQAGNSQKNGKHNRVVMEMPEFGGTTDVNLDEFLWNGERKAFIIYFNPRYINAEAKFKDEAEQAVNHALGGIYPVVAAVNVTANSYMIFESSGGYHCEKGEHGSFDEKFTLELVQYIHPDDRVEFVTKCDRDYLKATCEDGETETHMEIRMRDDDGEYHWVAMRFVRIIGKDADTAAFIVLMRGVDYRMNRHKQLQATLDATYSAIPGGVVEFLIDDKLTILRVNDAFCELVGKKPEDYTNGYKEHIHEDDREATSAEIYKAAQNNEPFDVIYRVYNGQDSTIHWVQCRGVKIGEREGKQIYLGIRLDVSELKNAEIDLLEERARADLAMGGSGNLRFEYNRAKDTLVLYYQRPDEPGVLKKLIMDNYSNGMRDKKEVYPEDADKLLRVLADDASNTIEIRLRNFQRETYEWYRLKSAGIHDSAGKEYVVGIIENIEKEKELEFINQNLQEQISFVIRDSYKRIYMVDMLADTCTIMHMDSERQKKPIHCNFTKLMNLYLKNRIHPLDLDNFRAKYVYLTSDAAFEKNRDEIYFDARIRDGFGPEYHWYNLLIKPIEGNRPRIICMAKCVDEIKKQEELERRFSEQLKYKKFSEKIIDSLGVLVEFRDGDSGAHIMRTRQLTSIMLNYIKNNVAWYRLSAEEIEKISTASAMHDVGKISIPDAILNKPARLTAEEFSVMKTHSEKGYNILKKLDLGQDEEFNRYCLEICRWHHERYDGNGYPDKLVGDEIPIWSQIVGLVDVYDALVSPRVYKSAYSHEEALDMIIGGECGSFNPDLLAGLRECAPQLRACYE